MEILRNVVKANRGPLDNAAIRRLFERIDLGLVGLEIALVFFFVNYMLSGSESGLKSIEFLWHSWGWMLGFIGFGLVVPLLLELGAVSGKLSGHIPVVVAAVSSNSPHP